MPPRKASAGPPHGTHAGAWGTFRTEWCTAGAHPLNAEPHGAALMDAGPITPVPLQFVRYVGLGAVWNIPSENGMPT